MKTFADVAQWCADAAEDLGDPSIVVCQLFFRWQDDLHAYRGSELACGMLDGELVLLLRPEVSPLQVSIEDAPKVDGDGALLAFGAEQITRDVWALTPSLNAPGLIHAFVVLYGVPDPAPWERRIVLPR